MDTKNRIAGAWLLACALGANAWARPVQLAPGDREAALSAARADLERLLARDPVQTLNERLAHYELQELALPADPGPELFVPVTLDRMQLTLSLRSYSILSPDFRVHVVGESGIEVRPAPAGLRTYRGSVAEFPGSEVSATVFEGRMWALVVLPWRQELWIEPLSMVAPGAPPELHYSYDRREVLPSGRNCGASDQTWTDPSDVPSVGGGMDAPLAASCVDVVDVAFDTDYFLYLFLGSSTNNVVAFVLAGQLLVDQIYSRDVGIATSIETIVVRTSPFYSSFTICNPGLLQDFQAEWNANWTHIQRDVAHLVVYRDTGSGIGCAFTSVVCSAAGGYGVSTAYQLTSSQLVGVVAHEVGHNFSAGHCDGSGTCNIMCSTLGGCSNDITSFAPVSIGTITTYRDTRTCLGSRVFVSTSASAPYYGTFNQPFLLVGDGTACPDPGGELVIEGGTYDEGVLTISNHVVLTPTGGVVRIQ